MNLPAFFSRPSACALSGRRSCGGWLALADGLIGAAVGFAVLHPLSMLIVQPGTSPIPTDMLPALFAPMGAYFTLIGLASGLLSGVFRVRLAVRNAELRAQKVLLETAHAEKDSLLRILTHDLVNALFASRALLKLASRGRYGEAPERLRQELGGLDQNLAQAEDLISFARTMLAVESGKLELPLSRHDLRGLVRESAAMLAPRAGDKEVAIRVGLPDEFLEADVEPVSFKNTVLNNLLSNAIKFSPPGGEVRVDARRQGGSVVVSVANAGPGIPAERLASLFAPSGRSSSTPGTAGERGTGFGLPLAERFARKMGGAIAVSSTPAGRDGNIFMTVFTVSIPAAVRLPGPRTALAAA